MVRLQVKTKFWVAGAKLSEHSPCTSHTKMQTLSCNDVRGADKNAECEYFMELQSAFRTKKPGARGGGET